MKMNNFCRNSDELDDDREKKADRENVFGGC